MDGDGVSFDERRHSAHGMLARGDADVARATGLGGQQLEQLEPAFEHEQSAVARELVAARS
jgi:hypothetical protein